MAAQNAEPAFAIMHTRAQAMHEPGTAAWVAEREREAWARFRQECTKEADYSLRHFPGFG